MCIQCFKCSETLYALPLFFKEDHQGALKWGSKLHTENTLTLFANLSFLFLFKRPTLYLAKTKRSKTCFRKIITGVQQGVFTAHP